MGIQLEWSIPDTDIVSYDRTYVYRADSESGDYTNITDVAIATNYYFDVDGTSTSWYKLRFNKSDTGEFSSYSNALQGAKWYGFCSINDVRDIANITSDDLTDTEIYKLINHSMQQLNADVTTLVTRERIGYLDETRENKIDSSNTTYYVKNWKGRYIADFDDDGDVDTGDITVYAVDSNGTETEATISSITPNEGKFVLGTAYDSSYDLYVTYKWAFVSQSNPDKLIITACAYLTAALAFEKINTGKSPQVVFGNTRFYRHMEASNRFYQNYLRVVTQINSQAADYQESEEII